MFNFCVDMDCIEVCPQSQITLHIITSNIGSANSIGSMDKIFGLKLYMIGGLGADGRVFKSLKLDIRTQVISWIEPSPNEGLRSYSMRLLEQIDQSEEFGLLGVSFGGIVAVEISKLVKPKKLILISSVETSKQLPRIYRSFGRTRILKLLPNLMIKPPKLILGLLFGTKNIELLNQIIRDTEPEFIRWALNSILNWSNDSRISETLRIHGTNDRLIPLKGDAIQINNGGHFMIVDRAAEISKLVNEQMKNAG